MIKIYIMKIIKNNGYNTKKYLKYINLCIPIKYNNWIIIQIKIYLNCNSNKINNKL